MLFLFFQRLDARLWFLTCFISFVLFYNCIEVVNRGIVDDTKLIKCMFLHKTFCFTLVCLIYFYLINQFFLSHFFHQVITELFRLILAVQTKIIDENTYMPLTHRCALHALLASTITLLVQLINLQSLSEHIYTVSDFCLFSIVVYQYIYIIVNTMNENILTVFSGLYPQSNVVINDLCYIL